MKNVKSYKFDDLLMLKKFFLLIVFEFIVLVSSTQMGNLLKLKSQLKINKYQSECNYPMDKLVTSKK
jgi:hypothetical protein